MVGNNNSILKVQKTLLWETLTLIILSLMVVVLFETDFLIPGIWAMSSDLMYIIMMVMELLTICLVPVALKMFRMKILKRKLSNNGGGALLRWGTLRILLIGLPMLLNTIFYYLFMAVAFAYMAVIGLLCFSFIYPSMDRCIDETRQNGNENHSNNSKL